MNNDRMTLRRLRPVVEAVCGVVNTLGIIYLVAAFCAVGMWFYSLFDPAGPTLWPVLAGALLAGISGAVHIYAVEATEVLVGLLLFYDLSGLKGGRE